MSNSKLFSSLCMIILMLACGESAQDGQYPRFFPSSTDGAEDSGVQSMPGPNATSSNSTPSSPNGGTENAASASATPAAPSSNSNGASSASNGGLGDSQADAGLGNYDRLANFYRDQGTPPNGSVEEDASSDPRSDDTTDSSAQAPQSDNTEQNGVFDDAETASEDCDLIFSAQVKDQDGFCTQCTSGDFITLVGVIENPCITTRAYASRRDCLVQEFDVYNLDFGALTEYPMSCDTVGRSEFLAPGDSITQSRPAGRLSSAQYELTILFGDDEEQVLTHRFGVE